MLYTFWKSCSMPSQLIWEMVFGRKWYTIWYQKHAQTLLEKEFLKPNSKVFSRKSSQCCFFLPNFLEEKLNLSLTPLD